MADSSSTSTFDPNEQNLSGNDTDDTYDPTDSDTVAVRGKMESGSRDLSGLDKIVTKGSKTGLTKIQSKLHEISDSEEDYESKIESPTKNIKKDTSLFDPLRGEDKDGNGATDVPSLKSSDTVKVPEISQHREQKKMCKYGSKCYRKNPSHFEEFFHPERHSSKRKHEDENDDENSGNISTKKKRGEEERVGERGTSTGGAGVELRGREIVQHAEPYCFLLTKVTGIRPQHNNTGPVSLKDLLHPSMGKLQKSAQFNYMFEIPWLVEQYPPEFRKCPLLLIHGFDRGNKAALDMEAAAYSQLKLCQARLDIMYGTHHTKMMFLLYDMGLRIVITTANLIQRDWYQKTQGVWVSPVFPRMPHSSMDGDSSTHFKRDLVQYLNAYRARQLTEWIDTVKQHDMSQAKVFLISSVPGRHTGPTKHSFGHLKLRKVLEEHGPTPSQVKTWPVIGQFSSIGSLGPTEQSWLCGEWYTSLSAAQGGGTALGGGGNRLKLIYPSKDNVRTSLEGYPAGGSLPYSINTAKKQTYLHNYLHQWQSEVHGRSRASPHIKSYCRAAPDYTQMAWFLVTSANLSKAAWGALEKKASQLMIRSYEIGVLFLPENYENGKTSFEVLHKTQSATGSHCFPQPYDLPPVPYGKSDRPWIVDVPYVDKPDSHGNMWCPD